MSKTRTSTNKTTIVIKRHLNIETKKENKDFKEFFFGFTDHNCCLALQICGTPKTSTVLRTKYHPYYKK